MLYVNTVVNLFYFKFSTTKILTGSIRQKSAHDVVNLQFALHSGNLGRQEIYSFLHHITYNFNLIVQVAYFKCAWYIYTYIYRAFCMLQ